MSVGIFLASHKYTLLLIQFYLTLPTKQRSYIRQTMKTFVYLVLLLITISNSCFHWLVMIKIPLCVELKFPYTQHYITS